MMSRLSSRVSTRSSMRSSASVRRDSTGRMLIASPHQSSLRASRYQVPGIARASSTVSAGTRTRSYSPCQSSSFLATVSR